MGMIDNPMTLPQPDMDEYFERIGIDDDDPSIDLYEERQIERFNMVGYANGLMKQIGGVAR